jgi:hypothetical protein
MKQLPKYAYLESSELEGYKIISLEKPYCIASVHIYRREYEGVNDWLENMAQDRYPIAKVKGYTIFLTMFSSLEPNSDKEFQKAVLNEMADFLLEDKIKVKTGTYMKSEESGKLEEKIVMHGRVMRERKNRIKKD